MSSRMPWLKIQPHKFLDLMLSTDSDFCAEARMFFRGIMAMQKGLHPVADEMIDAHNADRDRWSMLGRKSAENRSKSKSVERSLNEPPTSRVEESRVEENRESVHATTRRRFVAPSPEAIAEYLDGIISAPADVLHNEAQRMHDYYTANNWRVGRNPMSNWQAAARNWMRRAMEGGK